MKQMSIAAAGFERKSKRACQREFFDEMNRRFLKVIIDFYQGGPVGIEALAATLSEPRDTLEDVIEPYLLQNGFLARMPKGRVATKRAYDQLGLKKPPGPQGSLF